MDSRLPSSSLRTNGPLQPRQPVAESGAALMRSSSSSHYVWRASKWVIRWHYLPTYAGNSTHWDGFRVLGEPCLSNSSIGYIPNSVELVIMSPSGVQKERMAAEDMFVLSSDGYILSTPTIKSYPHHPPLFMKIYEMSNAGAIIHSHGMEACLVTMIKPFSKEFRMSRMEMIKGIEGHGYDDELVVPIIENAAHEGELIGSIAEAITAYPKTSAVLVRCHGVFIWGESWISAKTQAECYHYLFNAAIKLHQLELDWSTPDHGPIKKA